jgi:gas vesicle structural protein
MNEHLDGTERHDGNEHVETERGGTEHRDVNEYLGVAEHLGEDVALVEVIDRVIDKGVVLRGDIVLSVADVDLVHLGLQLFIGSEDTARALGRGGP